MAQNETIATFHSIMTPTTAGTYKYSILPTTKVTCKAYEKKPKNLLRHLLRRKGKVGLRLGDDLKLK